ncbi:MAG: 4Fe-4S binding protein [Dehalococcoidia bacterium]|nr:4Fe-4S binding protein [Dehalococcoidia bacterium]
MRTASVISKFAVERDLSRCTQCQTCVKECGFEANYYDALSGVVRTRQGSCVGCQNCMIYCPAKAISLVERAASTRRRRAN